MKTISDIQKEFYMKFGNGDGSIIVQTKIFNYFLTQSFRQLLEQVVPEERELPKQKCMNLENHTFCSCFQCEKDKGWNACRQQVEEKIKEILK